MIRGLRHRFVSAADHRPAGRRLLNQYRTARQTISEASDALAFFQGKKAFADLPDDLAIRTAYNVLLDRDPDPLGVETFRGWLADGMTKVEMAAAIRASDEFTNYTAYREMGPSVHYGRGVFVRSLPRARRILDLGGSSRNSAEGAFVLFDYPYSFEELVIVELPTDERHEHYRNVKEGDTVPTHLGPVRYRYHSMTDLSAFEDHSFDLVYSGQTIEHVQEHEADQVLDEVRRVLRPGGWFAFDTPNAAVCRLQQDDFIDPDHKVEYTHAQVLEKLRRAGLEVVRWHGLNYAGRSLAEGSFDLPETARKWGLYDDIESCYILAYVCRAPGGA
jgi:SAM-dependent methyltransferase